jgi:tetratricopeptide (TPR) repeat protein
LKQKIKTKEMQLNKEIDDLEYLSQLGYEYVPVPLHEISDLEKAVSRKFNFKNFTFLFTSLIVGMFLGISFSMPFLGAPKIYPSKNNLVLKNNAVPSNILEPVTHLDTLIVYKENFIKQKSQSTTISTVIDSSAQVEEAIVQLPAINVLNSFMSANSASEGNELIYSPNSSYTFIHDLKVSDYKYLYFKNNGFVLISSQKNVLAIYAARKNNLGESKLPLAPAYYLHELLADALLHFKNEKYYQSLNELYELQKFDSKDVNAIFYMGMTYFHLKNYSRSMYYFEKCLLLNNNVFHPEAEYYLACSLFHSGELEKANTLFQKIKIDKGFYAEKSEEQLAKF